MSQGDGTETLVPQTTVYSTKRFPVNVTPSPACPKACCFKREEAQSWLDQPFDEPIILFDDVVEILDLPQFHAFRHAPTRFEVGNGFGPISLLSLLLLYHLFSLMTMPLTTDPLVGNAI